MNKKTVRIGVIIIILCMMLSMLASASMESSAYIGYMSAYITYSGNDINIYFSIVGRGLMNEIGVSKILLYEQNGNTWSRVYTFRSDNPNYTADMLSYNTTAKADHVTYNGDSAKNYYAILYFYAADNNGSDTIQYIT